MSPRAALAWRTGGSQLTQGVSGSLDTCSSKYAYCSSRSGGSRGVRESYYAMHRCKQGSGRPQSGQLWYYYYSGFATCRASCALHVAKLVLISEWMPPRYITIFRSEHQAPTLLGSRSLQRFTLRERSSASTPWNHMAGMACQSRSRFRGGFQALFLLPWPAGCS